MDSVQQQANEAVVNAAAAVLDDSNRNGTPFAAPPASARQGMRSRRFPDRGALANAFPTAPVAVPAAQVAKERQQRVPSRSGGKGRPAVAVARPLPEVVPSVEALRKLWLAHS